jgi:ankyrin repeat protein
VFLAASEGHLSVLRYLLGHGGDPAMANARGVTPLHYAAKNGLLRLSSAGLISSILDNKFDHGVGLMNRLV